MAHPHLKRILEDRTPLAREEAREVMQQIFSGAFTEVELAALLGGITARGEHAQELAGFVDAMREAATDVPLSADERAALIDTCGTGGDLSGTFNISTAAALVAAAAAPNLGSPALMVAKHGNRAVTSTCGSADVLEALGIPVALSPEDAAQALRNQRFAFLHAPALHPAMKVVMPMRRALGVRTVFNVLGPLTNPAGARAQVMGVFSAHLVPVVAHAMGLLGTRHAFVVHGYVDDTRTRGMDEISISGPSQIAEVRGDKVTLLGVEPGELGLETAPIAALAGTQTAEGNADILREVFSGARGPRRDVVVVNAAAVLITAGMVPSSPGHVHEALRAGIALAESTIDSGAVLHLMTTLAVAR